MSSRKKMISLWSGPRNISTAMMYSFAQRNDTKVIDEPLYGHYLRETNADHPGKDEIMETFNCIGESVVQDLLAMNLKGRKTILFMKQMTKHLVNMDLSFLQQTENILLIRNPRDMLPSLAEQLSKVELSDTGFDKQCELYDHLLSTNHKPVLIDATELLKNPEYILNKLCKRLDIEFTSTMLSWKSGPRKEDGIWAKYWYKSLHTTTGFRNYQPKPYFPETLESLLIECKPYYEKLYKESLKANE